MKGLREASYETERLHLAGREDEGDLRVVEDELVTVIEAKSGKLHLAEFVREARAEAVNYAAHRGLDPKNVIGAVALKAPGKNWKDGYLIFSIRDYFEIEDD